MSYKDRAEFEARAESVLSLIESDFGGSGRDVRLEAIRSELEAVHQAARAKDAERIAELEHRDSVQNREIIGCFDEWLGAFSDATDTAERAETPTEGGGK